MCRNPRPFSSLVVLLLTCTFATAQNAPALMRAHRNNTKHRVHAERLETQSRVQEEALTPYQEKLVLRHRVRKGTRTKTVYAPIQSTPATQLYLSMRKTPRSTREHEEEKVD